MGAMASARTPYQEATRELLRQTLFGATRDQLERRAWSEVTMSDIAAGAGVSRQTLYKEFGSRKEFGLAFVINEGEHFLDDVEAAVLRHVDDPRAAVSAALELFLRTAGDDPLIRILLSDDGTGGMLPFVTTQGMPVVEWATTRLTAKVASDQSKPRGLVWVALAPIPVGKRCLAISHQGGGTIGAGTSIDGPSSRDMHD